MQLKTRVYQGTPVTYIVEHEGPDSGVVTANASGVQIRHIRSCTHDVG